MSLWDSDRRPGQGNLLSGIRYENLETNVDLPESLFELPANSTVISATHQSQIMSAMARAILLAVILIPVCAGVTILTIWMVLRLRRARRAGR